MQAQFLPQQHFGMHIPLPHFAPPRGPQLYHAPPTHEPTPVPVALPQPNSGSINPPARVTPQPILADAKLQRSMQNDALKDDLTRLEAQMTRILTLISRDHPNGA